MGRLGKKEVDQIHVLLEQGFNKTEVATNVEMAKELIEVGFEYVNEVNGSHLYRKRK